MNKKHHPSNRAERLKQKRLKDTLKLEAKGLDHASRRKILAEEEERERVILNQIIDQFE